MLPKEHMEDAAEQARAYGKKVAAIFDMSESERARLVWKGLAEYVNDDLTAGGKGFEELHDALRVLLLLYTHEGSRTEQILKQSGAPSFRADAVKYHDDLRNLFTWLCQ